jgi:hypothetical protein
MLPDGQVGLVDAGTRVGGRLPRRTAPCIGDRTREGAVTVVSGVALRLRGF